MHGSFRDIGGIAGIQKMMAQGLIKFEKNQQPAVGDVHVNTPLTNLSIAFQQAASNFVADKVFPNVSVAKKTDMFRTYDRGFWLRNEMEKRAPGAETKGIGHGIGTDTYNCDVYGLHEDIDDQTRANADASIDLDGDSTTILTSMAMIRKEVSWATDFFTSTSVWTSNRTGVNSGEDGTTTLRRWNDPASTPIEDVRGLKTAILERSGYEPNKLVLGRYVYDKLADHPDIVDRIKYSGGVGPTSPARVVLALLAQLFEVEQVLVMAAIQNTAAEGQTNAFSFIGGKHALLLYTPAAPSIRQPSAGYTFSWTGYTGASDNGTRMKRFRRDESFASDRVEIECAFDQKLIAADLGAFLSTIVA